MKNLWDVAGVVFCVLGTAFAVAALVYITICEICGVALPLSAIIGG